MEKSFYSDDELSIIGFKKIGANCKISRYARFYSPKSIEIGDNVRIDDFCILSGVIKLGSYIHISAYCALHGAKGIEIGDYSGTSARTIIYSVVDDFSGEFLINPMVPEEYTNVMGGKVVLKKYVQVGANSVIMPNITIEEGAVVGAFTLVKKDLEKWWIYAGIPALKIKPRSKNLRKLADKLKNEQIR